MTNETQIKRHEEFKQLCIYCYDTKKNQLPKGYQALCTQTGDNGFFAMIVKNKKHVVIVYSGTNDKKDILQDIEMWKLNKLPTQSINAIALYDKIAAFCKKNGYELSVTGHSLGGSLAAIVSAVRGVEAVTFNPYGVKNLLNSNIKYATDKIVNYCCNEDPITKINAKNHIGKCYSITSSNYTTNPHLLENMDPLKKREEVYAPYLQYQYEKREHFKKDFDKYKKYGRQIIRMPGLYSEGEKSDCPGNYTVSGYTRSDGTKVGSYTRTCYIHGN